MSQHKVIDYSNLPARIPLWQTVTAGLLLDRFQAPGWVWGVVGTIFVIAWIAILWKFATQETSKLWE